LIEHRVSRLEYETARAPSVRQLGRYNEFVYHKLLLLKISDLPTRT
jgi:hypothetical protein